MSMHFAPQWNKPIKPSGNALTTPTSESPLSTTAKVNRPSALNTSPSAPTAPSNVPFPALGTTPTTLSGNSSQPVLSYSRATHTPVSPSFPRDGSYFPTGDANGHTGRPHPFRYSKEAMLALWDEQKVKERPIELTDIGAGAEILVSKAVVKPVGLRDLSEVEKKLLGTSVHPPNPLRRQPAAPEATVNGTQPRRPIVPPVTRETGSTRPAAIGGFGRGEGGAFGGTLGKLGTIGGGPAVGAGGEGKPLGAVGGGFSGVKRAGRRTESGDAGGPWRPTRTISGSFEGVLGFGSQSSTAATQPTATTSNSASPVTPTTSSGFDPTPQVALNKPEPSFGEGGGPGWGTGQKKWRIAAGLPARETHKELNIPILAETRSDSVAATAPDTPLPERDATVAEPVPTPPQSIPDSPPRPTEAVPTPTPPKEDLGAIQWYYRDPGGQEQGPFAASQMHDWYSHSYFTDDLPLRRASESSFHTLAELKTATGNAVQPFLSPLRPRSNLPPNLPIPFGAQPMASPQSSINGATDNFRNLNLNQQLPTDPRISPMPQQPHYQQMPDRGPLPNQYAPHPAYDHPMPNAPSYAPAPNAWGQPANRVNNFGSVGMPPPIGQGPSPYSQRIPQPQPPQPQPLVQHADFFSPSAGVGALPASPWAIPQAQQNMSADSSVISPHQAWQQPQVPPVQQQYQPPVVDMPAEQESPQVLPEPTAPVVEALAPAEATSAVAETEDTDPAVADEPIVVSPPTKTPARKSTIDQPSRKSSISAAGLPTPPNNTSSGRLPPAPASLPAKPAAAPPSQPSPDKSASRPAPWAEKETSRFAGLSLREIQEAEAKEAEARRAARPVATSPLPTPGAEEKIQNMTWGLPTSQKAVAPLPSPAAPATPVWGGGDAGPRKTLKQIQEEEEKRKAKVAQSAQAGTASNGTATPTAARRGYADLAAATQPGQATGPGWTTVGASGKTAATTMTSAPRPASIPAKPVTSIPAKPASIITSTVKPRGNGVDDSSGPSVEFIKWTKQALTGLKINIDEFIQMLLSFPVDPPASSRGDVLEIISDSVYANSSTLDGRRFAEEFMTRRQADAARSRVTANGTANGPKSAGVGSLADVVKSVPKKSEDAGFRVVKAKGKKKN